MSNRDVEVLAQWSAHAGSTTTRVLLTHSFVVTMDPAIGDLIGDVLLRGDRIEAVGRNLADSPPEDAIVVDATGSIVMPGLVDSHVHAWEGAIRGIAPEADFGTYMSITQGGIAPHMRPEDVAIGERISAAQALNGGVSTFIDNAHNSRTAEHSDAAIEALRDLGHSSSSCRWRTLRH